MTSIKVATKKRLKLIGELTFKKNEPKERGRMQKKKKDREENDSMNGESPPMMTPPESDNEKEWYHL